MANKNIVHQSWEAERVFDLMRKKQRQISVAEISRDTRLPTRVVSLAVRDLRNARLIKGAGRFSLTPQGQRLKKGESTVDE